MSRKARQVSMTSYYHVIVHGIGEEYIFSKAMFKDNYLKYLLSYQKPYNTKVLAYCIMDNHAHMLIYCEDVTKLSVFMQKVNGDYAVSYNQFEGRVGYVFRDRFLSEPIENMEYFYTCFSYIHRNPVSAGITKNMYDYRYSSYRDFCDNSGIVTPEVLKLIFKYPENYLEEFHRIHSIAASIKMMHQKHIRISDAKASAIIDKILSEQNISKDALSDAKTLQKLLEIFVQNNISIIQTQRILNISRKKLAALLFKNQKNFD